MFARSGINVAALAAVTGLAASSAVAFATIFGGPTYDRITGTGYQYQYLPVAPGSTAGNGTAVGYATKYSGGTNLGVRAVRWDASGAAATELGTLGTNSSGVTYSGAYAINTAGTAVGGARKHSGNTSLGSRAVRWDASGTAATELGHLGTDSRGYTEAWAYAINTAGMAVGYAKKYGGGADLGDRAVRWDASGAAATELGTLGTSSSGSTTSYAYAISTGGTAVGFAEKYSGGADLGERAVRWDASGTVATELGNLGTDSSGYTRTGAYAINAAGMAVGYAFKYGGGTLLGDRAVRWDASGTTATELGNLGTNSSGVTYSKAYAINTGGAAVGYARKFRGGTARGDRAVRWNASGTAATELGTLGTDSSGYTRTGAYAINAAGMAVGYAEKYSGNTNIGDRAVAWGIDGVVIDLNTLLSPADAALWMLITANGISDTNWVTGIGTFDPDGPGGLDAYERTFLMQLPGGSCLSDFNHDGFVNGDDYDLFASLFDVADPGADINLDGFVNDDDYDLFAEHFEAGC